MGELRCGALLELSDRVEWLLPPTYFEAPRCLVYSNMDALHPRQSAHHLAAVYVARVYRIEGVPLCRLPPETKLVVVGADDFIPVVDGIAVDCQLPPYWDAQQARDRVTQPRQEVSVDEEAILIARFGLRTWGHWLGELLPKVVVVETMFPGRYRYVLPSTVKSDPVLSTLRQSLESYGVGRDRIAFVQPNRNYRFRRLHCVGPVRSQRKFHPDVLQLMRRSMRRPMVQPPRGKIALLRTDVLRRNVSNIDEIKDELKADGFTIVSIGNLRFEAQVATFAGAASVVGVLGSGLAGLMFSPLGVQVLTLAPGGWSDDFFLALMQERRARLADIRGESEATNARDVSAAPFHIAPRDLWSGLRALRAAGRYA
jgi:hypothetical protein